MIPNPIRKVLSSIQKHRVRALVMGGQACVLYGAAEFSRDTDLAVLASAANLARLRLALDDLQAHVIAVPPFQAKYLQLNQHIDLQTRICHCECVFAQSNLALIQRLFTRLLRPLSTVKVY